MSKCTSIDPLVTPYVDGELPAAERTLVDEHLHRCPPCYSRVAAEAAVRELMRARKPGLTAERASASLHAQCTGLASRSGDPSAARLQPAGLRSAPAHAIRAWWGAPWHLRVVPPALTASLVLLVGGAFLYLATQYSARLLAAELCADHVTCFAANNLLGTHDAPAAVESSMLSAFGWHLHLPEQFGASGLELVGGRRCLYGEGKVAHLMYRDQGRPVSIYMLPKSVRPEELLEILGHEVAIWSSGDRTFVLITRGSREEVAQMASFVKGALQ
ncbi:MAG TPA: zf-HC2 domain-containing protein [Vicinamibacterales bacterium]|jgi:anti-sigma factor RsiW